MSISDCGAILIAKQKNEKIRLVEIRLDRVRVIERINCNRNKKNLVDRVSFVHHDISFSGRFINNWRCIVLHFIQIRVNVVEQVGHALDGSFRGLDAPVDVQHVPHVTSWGFAVPSLDGAVLFCCVEGRRER